jgi:hypothetical protein
MRLGLPALLLAVALLPTDASSAGATAACAGLELPVPRLEVTIPEAPPPRIVETSEPEIHRRSEQSGSQHTGRNVRVPGLTKIDITGEAHYSLRQARRGGGPACTALAGIDARFSDQNVTIYVDRRYAPGTCERRAIMDHEDRHVAIGAGTLGSWQPRIQDELGRLMRAWAGRWLDASAQKRLDREIDAKVRSLVGRIQADAAKANAAIDTPASYREVTQRCANW